jgi:hypothetical protein
MQAQQLAIKIFAADPGAVVLEAFPPIFHRWIQENRIPDHLLIDVADYRHVPDGPGIVLIAHEAHIALDGERGPLGLLYSRKRDPAGELGDKLDEAFAAALTAARALEDDPVRPIRFRADRIRVAVMSRRFVPGGGDQALAAARPALDGFAARIYGARAARVEPVAGPREPFAALLSVAEPLGLADLPAR